MNSALQTADAKSDTQKPALRSWRWRYSLRMFLILVTGLCVWLAILSNRARKQAVTIAKLSQKNETRVYFDYQFTDPDPYFKYTRADPSAKHPLPKWLTDVIGEEYGREIWGLTFDATADTDLESLDQLGDLRSMIVTIEGPITKKGLAHFEHLTELQWLIIYHDKHLDGSCLAHFQELKNLMRLQLRSAKLEDDDLRILGQLKNLRNLDISSNDKITSEGLRHLTSLSQLRVLNLTGTSITDDGLKYLAEIKSLRRVDFELRKDPRDQRPGITKEGKKWLKEQLPNL